MRVASIQMAQLHTPSPDHFLERIAQFTRMAGEYGADFVCFPEHFTLQTLSATPGLAANEAMDQLSDLTDTLKDTLSYLARKHRIHIIGGSHMDYDEGGVVRNTSWFAQRDGQLVAQTKIHPTPDERDVWEMEGGDKLGVIDTDCGPVGITICYDSEFPELGRRLADGGALTVFVPYMTEMEAGHWRVTHCCQARAIENQSFMVTAGMTGMVAGVVNCDMAYARSRIITPCDTPFARGGIAAEATVNCEEMILADLDLVALEAARRHGAVRNLGDRRSDLYAVNWRG